MLKDPDALDRFFDTVFSHMLSREKMHSFLEEQRASDPYFPNYADAAFAFLNSEELRLPDLSVKTRVGISSHIETPALAKVLARYPFREIIVHPRVREEYYSGEPNWDS